MRIHIGLLIICVLLYVQISFSTLPSHSSLTTIKETPSPGGFWKTKTQWKAYWVKDWVEKKIYVPIWKKVWGPTEMREWVPTGVAKPPPTGWKPHTTIH